MKIGLIGLPQSGKKTFFRLLTGLENTTLNYGICKIIDSRLDFLTNIYQPKKVVKGEIEYFLLPSIVPGSGSFKTVSEQIKKLDALCLIVRDFNNESVFHINTTVDSIRDINNVLNEIILNDLSLAETRLQRISQEQKRNFSEERVKEEKVLIKIKEYLEREKFLNQIPLASEELKLINSLSFISGVNLLITINVDEKDIKNLEKTKNIIKKFPDFNDKMLIISAKIEQEISELSVEDKGAFLADLGIKESAIDYMTRKSAELLNLITFFTVGKDEVRAWMIKKNSNALEAAGKIHTDIARGFIRAEVFKYNDLVKYGTEEKIKEQGLFLLKGKDYIIEDGDIVCFRFNI